MMRQSPPPVGERLDDLEPPRYESTFPAERVPQAVDATSGGGGEPEDGGAEFVPTPYLDIMSVASKIHAHSKEASSYHRLFVEPLAIPDISHTGIKTILIDAAEPQRITYPNGRRRTNLQELMRAELRGAVYNSTEEFRAEDIDDKPGSANAVAASAMGFSFGGSGGATAFTAAGNGGRQRRQTAPASSRRKPRSLRSVKASGTGWKGGKKGSRKARGGPHTVHGGGGGGGGGSGRTTVRSFASSTSSGGPRTLERLTLPETSPFWRKARKPEKKRNRDYQVRSLLRNLRSFGHEKDVRK